MRLLKSMIYGYAGAAGAGLGSALVAVSFGIPAETAASAAAPAGIALGLLGLAFPWRQAVAARVRGGRR